MFVVNKEGQQQLVMATTTSTAGASSKAGYAAFQQTPAPTPQAVAAAVASVPAAVMPNQPQLPQSPASAASAAASERRNVAEILASLSGLKPIDLPSTAAGMATFEHISLIFTSRLRHGLEVGGPCSSS